MPHIAIPYRMKFFSDFCIIFHLFLGRKNSIKFLKKEVFKSKRLWMADFVLWAWAYLRGF